MLTVKNNAIIDFCGDVDENDYINDIVELVSCSRINPSFVKSQFKKLVKSKNLSVENKELVRNFEFFDAVFFEDFDGWQTKFIFNVNKIKLVKFAMTYFLPRFMNFKLCFNFDYNEVLTHPHVMQIFDEETCDALEILFKNNGFQGHFLTDQF